MKRPNFLNEPAAIRAIASACRHFAEDEDMWMSGGSAMRLDGCRDHGDIVRIVLEEEFLASRGDGRGYGGSRCVTSGSNCIASGSSWVPSGSNCVASGSSWIASGSSCIPSGSSCMASESNCIASGSSCLRAPAVGSGADPVASRADPADCRADEVGARADEVASRADPVDCRADAVGSAADPVGSARIRLHPQRRQLPFQQIKLSFDAVRVPRGAHRPQTARPQTVTRPAQVCPSKHPDGYIEALGDPTLANGLAALRFRTFEHLAAPERAAHKYGESS